MADYDRRHAEVEAKWAAAGKEFVTEEFWRRYLDYQGRA